MERFEQVGPVHHGIGRAEAGFDGLAKREGLQRLCPGVGKDVDALGGKAFFRNRLGKPQIIEHFSRVCADLKSGAEFRNRLVTFEHHHVQAEFGERQCKGQSGDASARDIDRARSTHGALGVFDLEHRAGRVGRAMGQGGAENIERRAIGADDLGVVAHVKKHMRVVERRLGADALEFLGADLDTGQSFGIVEVRGSVLCHESDHPAGLV